MNQCICVDCQNKCYEYENSITSDKAYFEWTHKKDKCKAESDELSDLTPCDDAISRQAAIDAFQMFREYESNRSNKEWVDRIETVLNQLPPVNPQPKTGQTLPDVDVKKFEQDPRYQNMVKMWGRKVAIEKYKSFVLGQ